MVRSALLGARLEPYCRNNHPSRRGEDAAPQDEAANAVPCASLAMTVGRTHLPPSRCFRRGSSASRAASPIRLMLRIATDSTRPGQKISDGLILKKGRPSAMILPQVGVSGLMPVPRNDRMASVRMAEAHT